MSYGKLIINNMEFQYSVFRIMTNSSGNLVEFQIDSSEQEKIIPISQSKNIKIELYNSDNTSIFYSDDIDINKTEDYTYSMEITEKLQDNISDIKIKILYKNMSIYEAQFNSGI